MQTGHAGAANRLDETMSGAYLHPLARVYVVPSSISVVEGATCLEHLNRIVSVETLELPVLGLSLIHI